MNSNHINKGKKLENCLACGGLNLETILDLNEQPLANSFVTDPNAPEDKFPLVVNTCQNCFHTQLSFAVNPDLMFKNYLYVSGTSNTLREYMEWFADYSFMTYREHHPVHNKPRNFLDIACNDGTQLDAVRKKVGQFGVDTHGIDPAENLYKISSRNHNVVCDYLNDESANRLYDESEIDGFDIINAQNVFAHNSDPVGFMERCRYLMSSNGLLFIQNSQADMIKNGEFDTIYHEHISFWRANSINECAKRAGLILCDHIRVPVHGISDLFIFAKGGYHPKLENILLMEQIQGFDKMKTYREFGQKAKRTIQNFQDWYHRIESNRLKVGFGAAAKGMTFLNACDTPLDYIIDENPLKICKFSPGLKIPIIDKTILMNSSDIAFVPLAWNFKSEIINKIKSIRKQPNNDQVVSYFPELKVEKLYD